jgi:hypothetical protein
MWKLVFKYHKYFWLFQSLQFVLGDKWKQKNESSILTIHETCQILQFGVVADVSTMSRYTSQWIYLGISLPSRVYASAQFQCSYKFKFCLEMSLLDWITWILLLINLIHIRDIGQMFFFSEVEMDLQFSLVTNLGAVCLSYKRLSTPWTSKSDSRGWNMKWNSWICSIEAMSSKFWMLHEG